MGIRQLASELQLSIGTVSRALNDRPDVNPETRARVKAAAALAGYVPNQSGRSLRSGRTGIVAAVIPSRDFSESSDSGLFSVLEGARRRLREHALDLIVLFRGPDENPLENLQRIVQRRIADAVIISQTTAADPRLAYLKAASVDYVAFGRSAGIDAMAAEAARLFVGDGHARIAIAASPSRLNYERLIFEALRAELGRLGFAADAVSWLPLPGGIFADESRATLDAAAPTAILAAHECFAAALYGELADRGLAIGSDVSVVSTFPTLDTRALLPSLSHFHADLEAVGVALADRLIALLPDAPPESARPAGTLVPLRFVPRASHGPAPAAAQSATQAALRAEERTQASTKATPATPSEIVG
jgi:DNA-binding LacI/PurR family transcriptional regulator